MTDIYGGIMDGLQLARTGAEQHKQRGLASLVGKAYSAPQQQRGGLLAQIAGIDPATATQTQSSLGAWDDTRQEALVRSAKMLLTAPEEARPQVWAQIVQAGEIPGLQPTYDPVKVPEMAQKIVQQFGTSAQGTPAGVQEFQFLTQGLEGPDALRARRIALGLDPRASSAAIQYKEVIGEDGRTRIVAVDPREVGAHVVGGGQMFGSGVPAPGGQLNPSQQFPQLAQAFGAQITSTTRSPDRNAKVGGVPNSFHLSGQAGDFIVPQQNKPAFMQQARQMGWEAIDEGDHVHLEPPPGARANPFVSQSPQERKFAEESGTQAARIASLPTVGRIEAENAGLAAAAKATAEEQAKFLAELPKTVGKADEALYVIDKALNHPGRAISTGLSGTIDPRAYLPGGPAADFKAVLEQLQGRAFLEAFESLKGGGQITEVEGNKATAAMARLKTTQSDEGFRQSLQDLRDVVVSARNRAIEKAAGGQRQQEAPRSNAVSSGGWSIEVSP